MEIFDTATNVHGLKNMQSDVAEGIALRRASLVDVRKIVAHRRAMFWDQGYRDEAALERMSSKFLPWLRAKMASGGYLGWLAITNDESIVASCGLWLMDWPAQMGSMNTIRGNILNVYTKPEFRGRGLTHWLIEAALEWCESNGIEIAILRGSDGRRSLDESMGFTEGNEMQI